MASNTSLPVTIPNNAIERDSMKQVADQILRITPFDWRVWDSGQPLPSAAANDDLGIVAGTFGTDVFTVQGGDVKTLSSTRRAIAHVALPDYYDDGQSVTIRLRAGMDTTVASTSCTLDVEAYEVGDSGGSGSDLCTTAAQNMNSLTPADLDFTITSTNLAAGDILEIRISVTYVDSATGTAVIPVLYKAAVLFDARG